VTRELRLLQLGGPVTDHETLRRALGAAGFDSSIAQAGSLEELRRLLDSSAVDLLLAELPLQFDPTTGWVGTARGIRPGLPIVVLATPGAEPAARAAVAAGADELVVLQEGHADLGAAMHRALDRAGAARRAGQPELKYKDLFDNVPVGLFVVSPDGRLLDANPALVRILGYEDREDLLARHVADPCLTGVQEASPGKAVVLAMEGSEWQVRRCDGRMIWVHTAVRPVPDGQGNPVYYEGTMEDITSQRAEKASLERQAILTESSPNPILEFTAEGALVYHNQAAAEIVEQIEATEPKAALQAELASIVQQCLASGQASTGLETSVGDRTYTWSFLPIPSGRVVLAYASDISRHLELETQLRQAQKMEAIGRLAGGLSHEFNNMLTVINGNVDMLAHNPPEGVGLRPEVREIRQAVRKAGLMTHQLMAFSRSQALVPRVLDLNLVVGDVCAILRRLLPADISVLFRPGPDLGSVRLDRGQIEQAIMSLALNARDAMPLGGRLTVETANQDLAPDYQPRHIGLSPGPYVVLTVSDSGEGMPAETRAKLFEPFFSMKGRRRGSGLGLATVHGIIKQSGGDLWVDSKQGAGTTFRIFLPRVEEAPAVAAAPAEEGTPGRGHETILLVEDEDLVRSLARRVLEGKGYRILESGDGEEAIRVAEQHDGPIHLLLTDVVMPKRGGGGLAEQLRERYPRLRALYMSAYIEEDVLRKMVHDVGNLFLQKPFGPNQLLQRVRLALETPPDGAANAGAN